MRGAHLVLAVLLLLSACAGTPLRPGVPAEVTLWRTDFAADRDALLKDLEGWDRCGTDRATCEAALFRVEVEAAVLSRIDSPSHPRIVDDALIPPPACLQEADQMTIAATVNIAHGARAGWDGYENGSLRELAVAQTEISQGRSQLVAASQLVERAPC